VSEENPITPVAGIDEIAAVRLEHFANAGHGVYAIVRSLVQIAGSRCADF
jgi:hypothetical protein